MSITAIAVAPPDRAEFARQGLLSAFLDVRNGRLNPTTRPPGGACVASAPLAGFQVRVEDADAATARKSLALMFAGEPVDWCVYEGETPRPRVVLCDMDSTIIQCETLDELADALDIGQRVSDITERAMQGELDFAMALKERVALLRGAPTAALDRVWNQRMVDKLTPGAKTMIATLRAHGAYTALVTGGFTYFSARVASAVGFDTVQANELVTANGTLTGTVREPIRDSKSKLAALEQFSFAHGEGPEDAIAIGDGANDADMVMAAGLGVGFDPKPALAKVSDARVMGGDLRAVLLFLGIPPNAWVEG